MLKGRTSVGDPEIFYFRKNSAASTLNEDDVEKIDLSNYGYIHLTGILPALSEDTKKATFSLIKKAKKQGLFISFDPNLRPQLWKSQEEMIQTINELASYADLVLPGQAEGKILIGTDDEKEINDFYLQNGASICVTKCGSKGAYVSTKDGEGYMVEGYKVEKVVDTVGAGDGFATGVVTGLMEGLTLSEAVKRGTAIGAIQVMSYIANLFSLEIAMLAFALVNLIALALTIIYVPSMPVKEKMSYGSQLKILKDINLWWALIAVILLNGANFGVYSYLADYLERVSLLSTEFVSITLLIFGLANILGNVIAGRLLSQRPLSFVGIYPFLLTVLFLVMLFLGNMGFVIMGIVLIWGILVGCAANINQYWITRVASNVPDFANALFLVATNVGTCIAAFVCGIFIDEFGINNVVLGGILFTVF